MPTEPSSGLLMYRRSPAGLEVLLFHRAGPSFARRDRGAWHIPISELDRPDRAPAAGGEEAAAGKIRNAPERGLGDEAAAGDLHRAVDRGAAGGFRPQPRRPKPRLTAAALQEALLQHARSDLARLIAPELRTECIPLGGVKMRGHRIVYVWACEERSAADPILARSAGQRRAMAFDRAAFLGLDVARTWIEPQQRRFLDQLEGLVSA